MPIKKAPLQLQSVVLAIKFDIIFGRLRPRERLIEDEILERFGTSRHILRAAFAELEQLGIVVRRPNRGAIVRDYTSREIDELYEMRALLQDEACRRMEMPPKSEVMADIEEYFRRYSEALEEGDLPVACTNNSLFHRRIWSACGSNALASLLDKIWAETLGIRCFGFSNPKLLKQAAEEHALMVKLLKVGDRPGFTRLCRDHMRGPLEAYKQAHGVWIEAEKENEPTATNMDFRVL